MQMETHIQKKKKTGVALLISDKIDFIFLFFYFFNFKIFNSYIQNGRVEGCALTSSCESTKIN